MKAALLGLLFFILMLPAKAQNNPDEITVFFPAFTGQGALGRNVSTVLSLQLAQTTRKAPWPNNPKELDFGKGMIKWSPDVYSVSQAQLALKAAQSLDLLAQLVILGDTRLFGGDVVVEVDVLLPEYQPAHKRCKFGRGQPCDFRKVNFEYWPLQCAGLTVYTPLPRRRYSMAGIVLKEKVVDAFSTVNGLPITPTIKSDKVIGFTGDDLRFLEFNRHLENAPTKLRSNGNEGYVKMPKISDKSSEFADMAGGLFQLFRGDWQAAYSSFSRVISNEATRVPLRVDAYLLRGMVQFRRNKQGGEDIRKALELAPYDVGAVRYRVASLLAENSDIERVTALLDDKRFLFDENDSWLNSATEFLACVKQSR